MSSVQTQNEHEHAAMDKYETQTTEIGPDLLPAWSAASIFYSIAQNDKMESKFLGNK